VHAKSTDVFEDPLIQPNYLDHPLDQEVMVAGMKIIRHLLHSPILEKYLVEETIPGVKTQTDEQMLDFCKFNGSTGYHLVGTARMGSKSDPLTVVDDTLRVHGIQNLRVVDASVMPMITSGNTYAATMMIAEKGADMIRGKSSFSSAPGIYTHPALKVMGGQRGGGSESSGELLSPPCGEG
jgi:choline dehydrogenase